MGPINIAGFQILEKLGEGGLGAVYKARQVSLDRLVAIKTLPSQFAEDPAYIEQFQAEAKVAATLKHPNIVQVHEAGEYKGVYYFAMEFVSGYTVSSWLQRKGRLPEEDALLVVDYVARALDYAWTKAKIVHGDIKPENIMVDEDGTIKLADFLALRRPAGRSGPDELADSVMGTPNFMSPEQVSGVTPLDSRSDMYALGALLYQLTTGELPFGDVGDAEDVMRQQLTGYIPDPCELNPELSMGTGWLIEKMMVKDRDYRYVNWSQLLADVARASDGKMPLMPLPAEGVSTVGRCAKRIAMPTSEIGGEVKALDLRKPVSRGRFEAARLEEQSSPAEKWLYVVILAIVVAAVAWMFRLRPPEPPEEPSGQGPVPVGAEPAMSAGPESSPLRERAVPESPHEVRAAARPWPAGSAAPGTWAEQAAKPPATDPHDVTASLAESVAAAPAPKEEFTQEQMAAGLREYLSIMEKMIGYTQRREYGKAEALLSVWLNEHFGHPYRGQIRTEHERAQMLKGLLGILETNWDAFEGVPVRASPNLAGSIAGIEDGVVTLVRRTTGGEARFTVGVEQIYERDLAKLLKLADPHSYRKNMIMLRISKGQLDSAASLLEKAEEAGDDVGLLRTWAEDWNAVLQNGRASAVLDGISDLVEEDEFLSAQQKFGEAMEAYGSTDIFLWAREADVARLSVIIESGVQATSWTATGRGPAADPFSSAAAADAMGGDKEGEDEGVTAAMPVDEASVDQVTVSELRERLLSYDGRIVKLRFRGRGDIRQVDAETYATQLGERGIFLQVLFPAEAYKWVKNIPKWKSGTRKSVYAVVHAQQRSLELIGKTRTMPLGKQAIEYSW